MANLILLAKVVVAMLIAFLPGAPTPYHVANYVLTGRRLIVMNRVDSMEGYKIEIVIPSLTPNVRGVMKQDVLIVPAE